MENLVIFAIGVKTHVQFRSILRSGCVCCCFNAVDELYSDSQILERLHRIAIIMESLETVDLLVHHLTQRYPNMCQTFVSFEVSHFTYI